MEKMKIKVKNSQSKNKKPKQNNNKKTKKVSCNLPKEIKQTPKVSFKFFVARATLVIWTYLWKLDLDQNLLTDLLRIPSKESQCETMVFH